MRLPDDFLRGLGDRGSAPAAAPISYLFAGNMQNCVFATEHDVTNHDGLESISRAGHDLVHSQHSTMPRSDPAVVYSS
jgi:hypothetical protein